MRASKPSRAAPGQRPCSTLLTVRRERALLMKRKISADLMICRSDEFRTFDRSTDHQIPELLHERRFTRKSSGSAIVAEVFMNNAGSGTLSAVTGLTSRMLKNSASLSCSLGLSGLFGLSRVFAFSGSRNKTNQIDQLDQINQTDQTDRAYPGRVDHRVSWCVKNSFSAAFYWNSSAAP